MVPSIPWLVATHLQLLHVRAHGDGEEPLWYGTLVRSLFQNRDIFLLFQTDFRDRSDTYSFRALVEYIVFIGNRGNMVAIAFVVMCCSRHV